MPAQRRCAPAFSFGAVGHAGDERAHGEAVDRDRRLRRGTGLDRVVGRIRNPVGGLHPEAVEHVVDHGDLVEVLDPIGAVIAGHDEAQREAVEKRQVLAVHAVGQHHLAVAGVVDVERLDEIGRRVA